MIYLKKPTYKGDTVRIDRSSPHYDNLQENDGWLRGIERDSIGYLYLVETKGGDEVYLRRSEFIVLENGRTD